METTYNYKVFSGVAPNPPTAVYVPAGWGALPEYQFGNGTKIVMVWAHDSRLVIRFSFDGVIWQEDIILYDAPQAEPFYLSAQKFQVQNYINGALSTYQVIGMW